jgi:hypothetical protein
MNKVDWGEIHLEWSEEHQLKSVLHLPTGVVVEGPWEVTVESERDHLLVLVEQEVNINHVKDADGWRKRDGH